MIISTWTGDNDLKQNDQKLISHKSLTLIQFQRNFVLEINISIYSIVICNAAKLQC